MMEIIGLEVWPMVVLNQSIKIHDDTLSFLRKGVRYEKGDECDLPMKNGFYLHNFC